MLTKGDLEVFAQLAGNLLYGADSSADLPTTGDWVYANFYEDDSHAIIHAVLPRKSLLKRKTAGKLVDFQLIAANIDLAFIMQSVDYNLNLRRLERYLVMVNDSHITPVVLLSKCDLVSEDELAKIKADIATIAPHTEVVGFSNVDGDNLETIKHMLIAGQSYCLIGSSGVGKTTLLNSLIGKAQFETQTVSKKDSKGKHTTTSRELIMLANGALLIDTPGMRELGTMSVDGGINETFAEILQLQQDCKFSNCSHTSEKGCAILKAIAEGDLSQQRYQSYVKMTKEAAFNDMSYGEKKKKDKAFGKMIKSVLKDHKKH
ncbi:MAG: ribosome biogenesis GTPase [Paraglaciecola sp.]|jgi:ribosome biogenesis GTPase